MVKKEVINMPTFAVNMKHSPESCPMFNDEVKNKVKELAGRMGEVAEKHEVKILSQYTAPLEHVVFSVVEAPSQQAVEKFYMEIGVACWNTIEIRQVISVAEVMKML